MRETNNDKIITYDKIKYLVEIVDDILTDLTIISSQIKELYVAKNSAIDCKYIDLMVDNLGYKIRTGNDVSTIKLSKMQKRIC